MSAEEASGVLVNCGTVHTAAQTGTLGQMLKGRKLALLSDFGAGDPSAIGAEAQLFVRAASEMGCLVARLRPGLSTSSSALEVQTTGRLLGRLYDALECQGLDLSLVQQIALHAGVPVFHGLASAGHRTVRAAEQLQAQSESGIGEQDARRRVVQAVLLGTLA